LESSVFTTTFSNNVASDGNIKESAGVGSGSLVDPWVQETKGAFTSVKSDIVKESKDSRESGGRGRSSSNRGNSTIEDDLEVNITKSRTIGGSS